MSKPATHSAAGEDRLLITLRISNIGWQIRGLGPGAYDPKNVVQGKKFIDFLEELKSKMLRAQATLNQKWKTFDTENQSNPSNIATVETCLRHATRAFATTLELVPYCEACCYGPTNPLYVEYIQRLEEIFTKCFTVAWMYGNPEQSMIGLHGLITDFQVNGGVDMKNGERGNGMYRSLCEYHRAHFEPNDRRPLVYQKYAEMIRRLSETVKRYYPQCYAPLAESIRMVTFAGQCFSQEIASPAKSSALEGLATIANSLAPEKVVPQMPAAHVPEATVLK
ncbi:MAG: hypothetical protein P4L61_00910 [Candidatus Pacebacteria bacterium]|nr:hypothetical protein [Candidatus Paceibacterota bacterium]